MPAILLVMDAVMLVMNSLVLLMMFVLQSPHAVLLFIAAVRPCVLEKILCASAGAVSACSPRAVSAGSAAILEITRAARPFFSGK